MIRQRKPQNLNEEEKSSDIVDFVKKFDAFKKVPEKYTKTTQIGGILSVISRAIIVYLVYVEVVYYLESRLVFKFTPDTDMDTKLKINIDLTVATPCQSIGADILDSTNQNVFAFGTLEEDDTWWELDAGQKYYFEYIQNLNTYFREQYHSLTDIIFKDVVKKIDTVSTYSHPERTEKLNKPFDACRVHGELSLNKVSGNFHITAGKSLHFPRGHIHLQSLFDFGGQNFSHRINRFSFGRQTRGIVHPLEGDEKIVVDSSTSVQYYIEIVPTDIYTLMSHHKTFQYSVKENSRPIDHDKGSHGNPGIYFKYDMSALKVVVKEERENIFSFSIRLCSVICGIVVICGFINSFLQTIIDKIFDILLPQYKSKESKPVLETLKEKSIGVVQSKLSPSPTTAPASQNLLFKNDLMSTNIETPRIQLQ